MLRRPQSKMCRGVRPQPSYLGGALQHRRGAFSGIPSKCVQHCWVPHSDAKQGYHLFNVYLPSGRDHHRERAELVDYLFEYLGTLGRVPIFVVGDFQEEPEENVSLCAALLTDLWHDDETASVKNWILETKCNCTYECALSFNILSSLKHQPKLIKGAIFGEN